MFGNAVVRFQSHVKQNSQIEQNKMSHYYGWFRQDIVKGVTNKYRNMPI